MRNAIKSNAIPHSMVFELGCYDGKALNFLPKSPEFYLGVDANWEGGLNLAQEKFKDKPNCVFQEVVTPNQIRSPGIKYELGICMETLEHLPVDLVDPYLQKMSELVDGYFLVTVPNEIGPVFAVKHLVKLACYGNAEKYSAKDYFWQSVGKTSYVAREQHKGFDYRSLIRQLDAHFEILSVESIHAPYCPVFLSFGVGVICKTSSS